MSSSGNPKSVDAKPASKDGQASLCVQVWSECVDVNRGEGHNFTEECRDATLDLQKCMEEHRDYYKDFMLDSEPEQGSDGGLKAEPETGNADQPGKTGTLTLVAYEAVLY